uniref:Uncharacterized protein n=1 Tax=Arundo donax TaxID=35708 RepID=A0A0A9BCC6_ARUDO
MFSPRPVIPRFPSFVFLFNQFSFLPNGIRVVSGGSRRFQ